MGMIDTREGNHCAPTGWLGLGAEQHEKSFQF